MKQLKGIVINTKMQQTAAVQITRRWTHPLYQKTLTKKKKYLCDNQLAVNAGDKVLIQECRPLSKRKKWKIVKKI